MGGAAVLAAAGSIPSALAIVTIGAPSDPDHVAHLFADAKDEIESEGEAEVTLGGRQFKIQKQFVDGISENNLDEAIGSLKKSPVGLSRPSRPNGWY